MVPPRRATVRSAGYKIVLVFALAVAGCRHPASEQECQEIFAKTAELELKSSNVTDPGEVARRIEEARAAKGAELTRGCVGTRITQSAMECVRAATSADELDRCLAKWW